MLVLAIAAASGLTGCATSNGPPGSGGTAGGSGPVVTASGDAILPRLRDCGRVQPGARYLVEHPTQDLYLVTDRPSFATLLEEGGSLDSCRAHVAAPESPQVALAAAGVLGWYGDDTGLAAGLELSADPAHSVRAAAAECLGLIGGERARAQLERMLVADDSGLVLETACRALGRIGSQRSLQVLADLARVSASARTESVRVAALLAAGAIGGDAAVAHLTPYLGPEHDPRVRLAAAVALGQTLAPSAVPDLYETLFTPDAEQPLVAIEESLHLLTYGGGPPSVGIGGETTRHAARLWDEWWRDRASGGPAGWRRAALNRMFPEPIEGPDPFDEDLVPILMVLLDSLRPWERRLAHDTLCEIAGDEMNIAPRALFSATWTTDLLATDEWRAWAASLEERSPPTGGGG